MTTTLYRLSSFEVLKNSGGSTLGSCFVAASEKTEGGGPPHDFVFRGKTSDDVLVPV